MSERTSMPAETHPRLTESNEVSGVGRDSAMAEIQMDTSLLEFQTEAQAVIIPTLVL